MFQSRPDTIKRVFRSSVIRVTSKVRGANMWAEDDLGPGSTLCLQSYIQPLEGNIYMMYHGTTREAAEEIKASGFKQSTKGMLGRGVYLSRDLEKASRYPLDLPEDQRVVLRVKVNVGKVKKIDSQNHPMRTTWHDHGYDTAWCPPKCGMVPSGLEEDCVWDPKRITIIDEIHPKQAISVLQSQNTPTANNVYKMYHGTSKAAAEKILQGGFRRSAGGMLGPGVYLSRDLEKASKYPLDEDLVEDQKVVLRVKVNVGNVIAITSQGHRYQKTWHDQGFDTAWCPPNCGMVKSGQEEDCVWDPSRITIIDVIPSRLSKEPQEGKVYRMYHGTSREAAEKIKIEGFRQSADGMLGRGVYLSRDLEKASKYPLHLDKHQKVVLRVMVKVGKVIRINYQGHPYQKTWHNHGYDTAWCPPCDMVPSGLEEDCVWDPTCITVSGVIRSPPCLKSFIQPQEGNIYRMYHGTSRNAAEVIKASGFKQSATGMLGRGVYLSRDLEKASRYPMDKTLPVDQRVVLRVKVNVGKVKKIDSQNHPMQKTWHDKGYDTAWCPPGCGMVPSGLEEDCVWDPKRITIIDEIHPKVGLSGAHCERY
ncbi:grass carp reovirus (GCRV)-induced gene 2e [Triplophysa dalaica]|uniref:grass carp reovirus (GCRV)-induced gene 2e n=1 Tax=Triplophysa dalaica TaxID=1582913 RepID=UPI0024E02995|nr:grass carp reovirus (GCRV)-induced gene 2e [Triplophysa dalaica]